MTRFLRMWQPCLRWVFPLLERCVLRSVPSINKSFSCGKSGKNSSTLRILRASNTCFLPNVVSKTGSKRLIQSQLCHCRGQTDSPTHHTSDSISDKSARKTTWIVCLPALVFSPPLFYAHSPVCFCPHPSLFHTRYQNHPVIRQTASRLDLLWLSLSGIFCRFDSG